MKITPKVEKLLSDSSLSENELKSLISSSKIHRSTTTYVEPKSLKKVRYGYLSDTHFGSKYFHKPLFDKCVKLFNKSNLDFILHPGDHIEGMSGRPGHIYELTHTGFTAQTTGVCEEYERFKPKIYAIDGNHDLWFKDKSGVDCSVGKEIENTLGKDRFEHLGDWEADLNVNGIKIKLYHGNDGSSYAHCFDDKTEILTENGWKFFRDLLPTEKVATLNTQTNYLEYQQPTDYVNQNYSGEMYHFTAKNFDLLVTPNHRLYCRRYDKNILQSRKDILLYPTKSKYKVSFDWTFKEARELRNCSRQEWQMKRGGQEYVGENNLYIKIPERPSKNPGVVVKHLGQQSLFDIAEVIGWYVTEGSIEKYKFATLNISQYETVNSENCLRIRQVFDRIGLEARQAKNKQSFNVGSAELCQFLISHCGQGAYNVTLPRWLLNQNKAVLQKLFDTMIAADGWIKDSANGSFGYKSHSIQLLNTFSEVCIKLGYAVTFSPDNRSISITKIQITPTINNPPEIVQYEGKIYCVSVPNQTILIRRNGKIIWSGNSYKLQKLIESFSGSEKPNIVHSGHYHKALYMFLRNVHGFESGTICRQTGWMRGKKIQAHVGFGIVEYEYYKNTIDHLTHTFYPAYD